MTNSVIAALTLSQLVVTYNNLAAIVDLSDVKKFADKAKGAHRVSQLLDRVNEYRYEEKLPLIEIAEGGKLVAVEPPAPKVVKAPAPKTAKVTKKVQGTKGPGRVAAVGPSDIIVLLVVEGTNPKFAKAAERFANYRTGIRVADYVAALGGDTRQALRDINWDKKQNWIKVVGPKSKEARATPAATQDTTSDTAPVSQLLLPAPAPLLMLAGPVAQASA